ncbi:MAG: hypothetical protein JWR67_1995, partial [Mucilaginibacter sp.]|nr:hypothetical protein [Mucilaginibacter sp.]
MSLKSTFTGIRPREKAGSTATSRFDFQKDVSIAMLLDHEEKERDYVFVFDYHEDLVIMDTET